MQEAIRSHHHVFLQDVKAGLDPHFVDRYEQIYCLAFPQQQKESAA
jgi:hypothetical protein